MQYSICTLALLYCLLVVKQRQVDLKSSMPPQHSQGKTRFILVRVKTRKQSYLVIRLVLHCFPKI